jgi:Rrf2 family protein
MGSLDAKTRYALLAALDLAENSAEGSPAKVREIAARTGTPGKYLVHILLRLKKRALVNSTRGVHGGYWLVRPPESISAAEVVAAVQDGARRQAEPREDTPYDWVVDRLEEEAEDQKRHFLARISLAEMLQHKKAGS